VHEVLYPEKQASPSGDVSKGGKRRAQARQALLDHEAFRGAAGADSALLSFVAAPDLLDDEKGRGGAALDGDAAGARRGNSLAASYSSAGQIIFPETAPAGPHPVSTLPTDTSSAALALMRGQSPPRRHLAEEDARYSGAAGMHNVGHESSDSLYMFARKRRIKTQEGSREEPTSLTPRGEDEVPEERLFTRSMAQMALEERREARGGTAGDLIFPADEAGEGEHGRSPTGLRVEPARTPTSRHVSPWQQKRVAWREETLRGVREKASAQHRLYDTCASSPGSLAPASPVSPRFGASYSAHLAASPTRERPASLALPSDGGTTAISAEAHSLRSDMSDFTHVLLPFEGAVGKASEVGERDLLGTKGRKTNVLGHAKNRSRVDEVVFGRDLDGSEAASPQLHSDAAFSGAAGRMDKERRHPADGTIITPSPFQERSAVEWHVNTGSHRGKLFAPTHSEEVETVINSGSHAYAPDQPRAKQQNGLFKPRSFFSDSAHKRAAARGRQLAHTPKGSRPEWR